jgi:hypothetical protein
MLLLLLGLLAASAQSAAAAAVLLSAGVIQRCGLNSSASGPYMRWARPYGSCGIKTNVPCNMMTNITRNAPFSNSQDASCKHS